MSTADTLGSLVLIAIILNFSYIAYMVVKDDKKSKVKKRSYGSFKY